MGFFKFFFCLFFKFFFCLFFLLLPAVYGKNSCRASVCGKNTFLVKFPFRLQDQQPKHCGYHGFDLSCNRQGMVTLKLPQSGDFFVQSIDYLRQEIKLYDPSGCVENLLPKLNLSGSPFRANAYINFSFLSCSSQLIAVNSSLAVGCLSNSTNTVLAMPSVNAFKLAYDCPKLFGGPIQVPRQFPLDNNMFSRFAELEDDIPLRWSLPDCGGCESRGGTCELANDLLQVTCRERKARNKGLLVFGIVSLSVTCCAFTASFLLCFTKARRMRNRTTTTTTVQVRNFDNSVAVTQQPANTVARLDEATILSYTRVVLGESCRLPGGTSDGTCPICLSEYTATETVKFITDCSHWFHADCIDMWLRLTRTCPVCRTALTPLPTRASS